MKVAIARLYKNNKLLSPPTQNDRHCDHDVCQWLNIEKIALSIAEKYNLLWQNKWFSLNLSSWSLEYYFKYFPGSTQSEGT